MRILVLISGNGSNLQAIINYFKPSETTTIAAVISNRPDAYGLTRAEKASIPHHCIEHSQFSSREAFDQALTEQIDHYQPDLIVLAGFMRKLTPEFVQRYYGKMINIHPSLLPKYRGLHTHTRVLENGDSEHGATIHYVSETLDGGPIIAQSRFTVDENDTIESLEQRIHKIEHQIYPKIIQEIVDNHIKLVEDHVHYRGKSLPDSGMMLKI
ncbi:MAG: phosphoribosylglycinamide formyltransferase [Gammaproteobacteria bacterium]|nr:phosphoribosylglycinamide formyltransferase [Gammaproteobacteria bacterium]MCH9744513.1 phosphoribosylglycinamide formyltransferase [Gammaproteobacteria bacterium]